MVRRTFKTEQGFRAYIKNLTDGLYHVEVQHDDICSPSICQCKPWYVVTLATKEVLKTAAIKSEKWAKETSS